MRNKRQFAVLGLGRFGVSAAMTLENMGYEVLAVDMDTNLVSSLTEKLSQVVSFDMRDARAMDQAGIGSFDTVIIATKNLEASLMAAMLCKERQVPEIVVNAFDERHAEMARRLGATKIIFSERDMARRTGHASGIAQCCGLYRSGWQHQDRQCHDTETSGGQESGGG